MYIFVCSCLFVLGCMSRIERDMFLSFSELTISFGERDIKLFEFYKVEDPEHLFGEGKCPLTNVCPIHMIIYFPALHN
jgi:hypothetical protein